MLSGKDEGAQALDDCRRLVSRFVEAVNTSNLDAIDQLLDPGYSLPGGWERQRVKDVLALYRRAVPDAHWVIHEQIVEASTVVTRFTARGTHRGPCLGLAPTGRSMAMAGVLFSRCRDGRITEHWLLLDLMGLLQQLDVMPSLPLDQIVAVAGVQRANARWTRGER